MIRVILDTSLCVEIIRGRAERTFRRLRQLAPDEAALSSITLAELEYGVSESANPGRNQMLLVQFCAPLRILPFDEEAAQTYGAVRAALEAAGTPIGPLDTLIAAHALAVGATLLTMNESEFHRVPDLRVENWQKR